MSIIGYIIVSVLMIIVVGLGFIAGNIDNIFPKNNKKEDEYIKNKIFYNNHQANVFKKLSTTEDGYVESLKYVLNFNANSDCYTDKVEKEIEEVRKTYKTYLTLFFVGYNDEAKKVGEKIDSLVNALYEAVLAGMTPAEYEEYKAAKLKEAKEYLESVGYKLDKE